MDRPNIEKNSEKDENKYIVAPTRYFNYDINSNSWTLEIHIPGVKKDNISFKIAKESYLLKADNNNTKYKLEESFPFEADSKTIKGDYINGLLTIEGKIKDPLSDAFEIKLKQ